MNKKRKNIRSSFLEFLGLRKILQKFKLNINNNDNNNNSNNNNTNNTTRSLVTFNQTYIMKLRRLKIINLPSHIEPFPMQVGLQEQLYEP